MTLHIIAIAGGIAGDIGLCWLSWRLFIRPKLIKFVDSRIELRMHN